MTTKRGALLTIAFALACAAFAGLLVMARQIGPETKTIRHMKMLVIFTCNFEAQTGRFPRSSAWAEELIPGLGGILASPRVAEPFFDGWGRPFRYVYPGAHNIESFDLYSIGPNGTDENGNGDDIGNLERQQTQVRLRMGSTR